MGSATEGTAIFTEDMENPQILLQLSKKRVALKKCNLVMTLNYMLSRRRNAGNLGAQRWTELTD